MPDYPATTEVQEPIVTARALSAVHRYYVEHEASLKDYAKENPVRSSLAVFLFLFRLSVVGSSNGRFGECSQEHYWKAEEGQVRGRLTNTHTRTHTRTHTQFFILISLVRMLLRVVCLQYRQEKERRVKV